MVGRDINMRTNDEILLTSDIHLGSNLTCVLDFIQFLDNFIRDDNYRYVRKIVFLGDVLELMFNDLDFIMNYNGITQIFDLLREISNMGIDLHFILGNHDIVFIGEFEDEMESFQNVLESYNCNFFQSISLLASFSFNNGFTPFNNFEKIHQIIPELSSEPQYLFLHGHQLDEPLIIPTEQRIWARKIKDDQIQLKQLCDYLKYYCWNCYLRNQGRFLPAWEEFKEIYYRIDKSDLSQREITELWKFKIYLYFWLLRKRLKMYPSFLNSYKEKIFFRARNYLISNNISNYFSHVIFGHTHIPGFYEPSNNYNNAPNIPVLVNTGTWQQGEYGPYIIRLSITNGINFISIGNNNKKV